MFLRLTANGVGAVRLAAVCGFDGEFFGAIGVLAGVATLNPGCVSSDGALLRLARSRRGLLHVPQKVRPGGSGRGVQQDETRHPSCDCQVSRTRIAYQMIIRKRA